MANENAPGGENLSRRTFVKNTAGVLAGATLASYVTPLAYAAGSDVIRVGLIGCGGRGTGAAVNALQADEGVKIVALGDVFADHLARSRKNLENSDFADRVDVTDERSFTGFDAYKGVIAHSDVVILTTPPHFRPAHIEAAIEAGVHVFAEKPAAVDPAGVRRVIEATKRAQEKNLCFVSGFCYRYDQPKQELMARIHEGAIGDITALQCTYNTGALWHKGRNPAWSDMEWQLRNWLYFTWLSGDHIAEQSCHSIDKTLWAMKDVPPAKCTASGGRIVRTSPDYGDVFDHFNSVFEWDGGVKCFHSCRQWAGADSDVSDYAFGTKGTAALQHHRISGENEWRFKGKPENMYVREHRALFGALRKGEVLNNGDYMYKSTLMAIMARMSAFTGKTITWQQALESKLDLTPPSYEFGPLPVGPIAQPGQTKFI